MSLSIRIEDDAARHAHLTQRQRRFERGLFAWLVLVEGDDHWQAPMLHCQMGHHSRMGSAEQGDAQPLS